jgi:hypothetical protein
LYIKLKNKEVREPSLKEGFLEMTWKIQDLEKDLKGKVEELSCERET